MIGPPTLEQRIADLEGVLAAVRIACQRQMLVYGTYKGIMRGPKGQQVNAQNTSDTFRLLRDMLLEDPAAREDPPGGAFTRAQVVRRIQQQQQSPVRDAVQRALTRG